MLRKIIPVLFLLILAGVFSCNEGDPITPKTDDHTVAPPPRSINVNAKLQSTLATQTADVYVRVNSGTWTLVNSVPGTTCTSIGSFSANDGDSIEFMVVDAANFSTAETGHSELFSRLPSPLRSPTFHSSL
jgi:hypothetical protein